MKPFRFFKTPLTLGLPFLLAAASYSETVWNLVTDKAVNPADAYDGIKTAVAEGINWLSSHPTDTLVLYFPAGTYAINHPSAPAISIANLNSGTLVFRGAGEESTTVVFNQFDQLGFKLQNANHVAIEKMHLTRPGLYVTQGTVTDLSAGSVTIKLDEGFPDPVWLMNQPLAQDNERTLIAYDGDPTDPKLVPSYSKVLTTGVTDNGGGLFTFAIKDTPLWKAGDHLALKCKVGLRTILLTNCDDFVLQDVRSTRSSAATLWANGDNDRMLVQRVTVARPEPINGKVSFFSQPGDGLHVQAGTYGPTIRDCSVTGTGDDGIPVFSSSSTTLMTGTVIENNTVRDVQPRGILITQSQNGICRNNTIIRSDGPAIGIRINGDATGSAAAKNWTISNNTLIHCMPTQKLVLGVIDFSQEVSAGLHNNIRIENNTFIDAPKNGHIIGVNVCDTAVISGNVIKSFSSEENFVSDTTGDALVYDASGKSVTGTGNVLEQPSSRTVWKKANSSDSVAVSWIYQGTGILDGTYAKADVPSVRIAGNQILFGSEGARTVELFGLNGRKLISQKISGASFAIPAHLNGVMIGKIIGVDGVNVVRLYRD